MSLRPFRLLVVLPVAGCLSQSPLPTDADIDATRGATLFAQSCAACHGADAMGGRGPDLTALAARNGGTFPRDAVMATIDGLDRHGDAGAVMPEFGAQGLGATVIVEHDGIGTPIPADLLALTAYLDSVQG